MSQQPTKRQIMLAVVATLAVIVVGAAPALAQPAEIPVTGVVEDEHDKADGTPVYGIKDKVHLIQGSTKGVSPRGRLQRLRRPAGHRVRYTSN